MARTEADDVGVVAGRQRVHLLQLVLPGGREGIGPWRDCHGTQTTSRSHPSLPGQSSIETGRKSTDKIFLLAGKSFEHVFVLLQIVQKNDDRRGGAGSSDVGEGWRVSAGNLSVGRPPPPGLAPHRPLLRAADVVLLLLHGVHEPREPGPRLVHLRAHSRTEPLTVRAGSV